MGATGQWETGLVALHPSGQRLWVPSLASNAYAGATSTAGCGARTRTRSRLVLIVKILYTSDE